jgi:hypothetical protein
VLTSQITLTTQAEQIADKLNKIGLSGGKFERVIKDLECKIGDDSSSQFEQGLAIMGEFLGFCSMRYGKGDSAPDVIWWTLNKEFCIVFEAKSNEDENGGISTSKLRQSRGHIDWAMCHFINILLLSFPLPVFIPYHAPINLSPEAWLEKIRVLPIRLQRTN